MEDKHNSPPRRSSRTSTALDAPEAQRRRASKRLGADGAAADPGPIHAASSRESRVAQRAYELYQARGGSDGDALRDWLEAERQIDEEADARR